MLITLFKHQLALLATMHAAILAVSPHAPPLAFAVWLGGASLAVCGLFIVQYFSVTAFGITDEDLSAIVDSGRRYVDRPLLAVAMIMPILASCWSGVLFAVGIFDYVVESDMGGGRYRAIAFVPIGGGLIGVLFTIILGKRVGTKVESKVRTFCSHCQCLYKNHLLDSAMRRPSLGTIRGAKGETVFEQQLICCVRGKKIFFDS